MCRESLKRVLISAPLRAFTSAMLAKKLWRVECISSGLNVRIWNDKWIPRSTTFAPLSRAPEGLENAKVATLIDPATNDWDTEIVNGMFSAEDQNLIFQIPVGHEAKPDLLCWHYSNNGRFSVKSAYFLALDLMNCCSSSGSSNKDFTQYWKTIRNLTVPNKIRLFCWKLCLDALPTALNITKWIHDSIFGCPFCHHLNEDTVHTFILCDYARQTWALSHLRWSIISPANTDPTGWFHHVVEHLDINELEFFIMLCWFIWWGRKKLSMGATVITPDQLILSARSYLSAYQGVYLWSRRSASTNAPGTTQVHCSLGYLNAFQDRLEPKWVKPSLHERLQLFPKTKMD
ncbi:UNVERIFIED_CONTAM: hypothetical protein Slati_3943200 [Sesamum latifolium]|uniref:Reverse transcriptase zinc-binding domain-containing protein n=1 Tax=Sesamum latifolium TaxID=2727402 RepID=A0AAW2TPX8_9LAMI